MAASCSKVPKHIISERKMRVVLYDMLIAEAMVETMPQSYPTSDERLMLFDAVFAKHHITQTAYDSSLIWYGKHMDLYMSIYRLVLKDVNAGLTTLAYLQPNPISGDNSASDSIDIWIFRRNHIFSPVRAFNAFTFNILPQLPYKSGSSYVLTLSVWGIPPEIKYKPVIHLNAVQTDTIISVKKEISGDGLYEATVHTVDTLDVERIYGYIFLHETDAFYHRIYLNDIHLMKYNTLNNEQ